MSRSTFFLFFSPSCLIFHSAREKLSVVTSIIFPSSPQRKWRGNVRYEASEKCATFARPRCSTSTGCVVNVASACVWTATDSAGTDQGKVSQHQLLHRKTIVIKSKFRENFIQENIFL